jgi:hypothetical protein
MILSSSPPPLLSILSLSAKVRVWSEDYSLHAATSFDPWYIPSISPVSLFAEGLMKRRASILGWLQRPREMRCCYLHFARLFRQRCCRGVNSIVANSLQFSSWISLLLSSSPAHRILPPAKNVHGVKTIPCPLRLCVLHVTQPSSPWTLLVDGGLMERRAIILRLTAKTKRAEVLLAAFRPPVPVYLRPSSVAEV